MDQAKMMELMDQMQSVMEQMKAALGEQEAEAPPEPEAEAPGAEMSMMGKGGMEKSTGGFFGR